MNTPMSPTDLGTLVLVLLGAGVVAGAWGWTRAGARVWAPASLVTLAAAAVVAAASDAIDLDGRTLVTVLVVLAGMLAVVGGGPVTTRVFELVDGQERTGGVVSLDHAGTVLRGGAWIGALERAAVFASLAVGQPEGVAIVLALKGLGRYPELRNQEHTGTAERFIIGTFTSVLWAAACAGVVRLLVP